MWADHLEDIQLTGLQGQWDAPIRCQAPQPYSPKEGLNNSQIVYEAIMSITGDRDLFYGKIGTEFVTKLNLLGITREEIVKQLTAFQHNKYKIERVRCGQDKMPPEDFIEFAHSFG